MYYEIAVVNNMQPKQEYICETSNFITNNWTKW